MNLKLFLEKLTKGNEDRKNRVRIFHLRRELTNLQFGGFQDSGFIKETEDKIKEIENQIKVLEDKIKES